MEPLAIRYQDVLLRIRQAAAAGPAPTLLAVSKGQPADKIEALFHLGHRDFAENYVQELLEKAEQLEQRGCAGIRWHFIGHLQTNKVKALLQVVDAIHAIDSEKLAREISKRWKASGRAGRLPVFIEVNIDAEPSKSGLPPEETLDFARAIDRDLAGELDLRGLMCIPAPGSTEQIRTGFARLRELELKCRPATHGGLSMGMSGDFELAVAEGATHVRVGTALFGERPQVKA